MKPMPETFHSDLCQVAMNYQNHACYMDAMQKVEARRGEMQRELSEWTGETIERVVQFIGSLTFGGAIGKTFDEQLSASHGYAHIQWIHEQERLRASKELLKYARWP
jgi:hypothetical protein